MDEKSNLTFILVIMLLAGSTTFGYAQETVTLKFRNDFFWESQTWMLKNLDVDHYRNGDLIPEVKDSVEWANLTTGAWCYYENNSANRIYRGATYGKLYNWYAVNDPRGLAPVGWHVPTIIEFSSLTLFLRNTYDCPGAAMKENSTEHWMPAKCMKSKHIGCSRCDHVYADNLSGWTGLPGGNRWPNGIFEDRWYSGDWWTSNSDPNSSPEVFNLSYNDYDYNTQYSEEQSGYSVRCIKD